MWLRVEPKDFAMVSVYLLFNKEHPDPEDGKVKTYLQEHHLEPKRQEDTEVEGVDCHMMYFGGCYIRNHMPNLKALNQQGAEETVLTREIERVVSEEPSEAVGEATSAVSGDRVSEVKSALLERFHTESSFGPDDEGYVELKVSDEELQEAFLELARP